MPIWDPERYLTYADERGRPFFDLLARVGARDPGSVVDLGCGPGNLTSALARRWPNAELIGIDASAEMIGRARRDHPRMRWQIDDLRSWLTTGERVDVLISNATLQWVPRHLELLPDLVGAVEPGGWLAFQVPGNFEEPSHVIRRELAAEPAYAAATAEVATPHAHDAATYLERLRRLGCTVDAWETTYLHLLTGEDPVFTWVSGTGARPTLEALDERLRPRFEEELKRRLRAAYPERDGAVVMPFRRVFVVAQVSA